jgi:hypothetical protein
VKFVGGLDETCQVLYNGLQDVHKIGAKTQCVQGAQRILMERNDKPRKGLSTPCKHNGKHTHLTTSFYIRSASHDASASIYIRITEGRGAQFRFNTGYGLNKASSWNAKTRSVRSPRNYIAASSRERPHARSNNCNIISSAFSSGGPPCARSKPYVSWGP